MDVGVCPPVNESVEQPLNQYVYLYCPSERPHSEEEVRFLGRQEGERLPAAFVAEAVRIAEAELVDRS
ncbi:hypothetical protein [Streptomyces sp. NPDC001401]|uniref:hypothetical protein n=1 Tax=Streptomyces sp. NPDC001401 TaxID=3364570 RepID=UPI0036BEBDA0